MPPVTKYELWDLVRPKLGLVVFAAVLGFVLAFGATYFLDKVYKAEVTLLPVDRNAGPARMLGLTGALGDLASIAGVTDSGGSRVEVLETLKSRAFIASFIKANELTDSLLTESDLEDLQPVAPADRINAKVRRATQRFMDEVIDISDDKRTGVVRIAVYWTDPQISVEWANGMAHLINVAMRDADREDVQRRLEYLKEQALASNIVGVQEAIFKVMESEIKSLAIASASEEFAFKIIDPAVQPETDDYVRPNRPAMALVGFLLLGCAAIAFAVMTEGKKQGARSAV